MNDTVKLPPEITAGLRPKLTALEPLVQNEVCVEVTDPELRKQMLENKRIANRLFDIVLGEFGLPLDDELAAYEGQDKLAFVLDQDRDALCEHLGLAHESQRLALHLVDHTLDAEVYDLGLEKLRQALRYRDLAGANFPDAPLTLADVKAAGEVLLSHWVWSLPSLVKGRAAIALNVMEQECTPPEQDAKLADAVISDLLENATQEVPA